MKYEDRYMLHGKYDLQGMITNDDLHFMGQIVLVGSNLANSF